ncbi:MAG: sigma factor [Nocardioidaceae bacterium]
MSESFEEFAAGRAQDLWRAAWLLTGDRALAEDLVQTALMKSWPRFERLTKNGGSFEGYVRRTMYSTYCTWWRRHWKASAIERDEEQHDPALERSDLLRDLSSALS